MTRLLATAIKNNKTNHLFQISEAPPFRELVHVIFADQAVNRRISVALPNLLDRIDGVGRPWTSQLAIIHCKSRFSLNSGLYHPQAYFVFRNGRGLSERRQPSGNKDHFLSAKSLKSFARNDKMAVMNRIKCAAVNCDLFQRSMLNVQRSIFNSVSCHVEQSETSLI